MTETKRATAILEITGKGTVISESRRKEALLKTRPLQNAIQNSANFSIIATDEKGIIQLFNVGAERMQGYMAAEVLNKISPSDMHDPDEVMARADPVTARIPVAGLSANAAPSQIRKGRDEGFFRYLTKPTMVGEFMDTLGVGLKYSVAGTGASERKAKA
jgi:PAS domain-containing protein